MFDDSGAMRITKTKSVLKQKLQVEQSSRTSMQPQVVIIDGCAILWVIHWPESGTVQNIIDGLINYVIKLLKESDVYAEFDCYYEHSIKSVIRCERAGEVQSKQYKISPNMP